MIYVLAGLAAAVVGFVLGRFSFNVISDVWHYIFPPLKDEAPSDCIDFKNAGAAVGVIGAVGWCEIALLCGSPLWAVLGGLLGGLVVPLIGLVLCVIGALAVVLVVLCFLLLDAGVRSLGLLVNRFGGFVDKGYARAKRALPG